MVTPRTPRVDREESVVDQDRTTAHAVVPFPSGVSRPVVARVRPQVDCGRRPAKASVGEMLRVEADAFVDGHDVICTELRFRHESDTKWTSVRMNEIGNDRWRATLPIERLGRYRFIVRSGVDRFATWRRDLKARLQADDVMNEEYLVGAQLLQEASRHAKAIDRQRLLDLAEQLRTVQGPNENPGNDTDDRVDVSELHRVIFSDWITEVTSTLGDSSRYVSTETYFVIADPSKARFSTWYELFPRSAALDLDRHGTFADVEARLDYVQSMGFDVLYLPPIHPIGLSGRKGRNGAVTFGPNDPGSPWAIGTAEGGHTAIHGELGTLKDFRHLVNSASERGIDVALDLAFQTSPDHAWVLEHPDWFHQLPGGSIRYAENPPKRYEDIYPLNFAGLEWRALWHELLDVVRYWIDQGVTIFRVDNPHTKPFSFWEWLIASVKSEHPDTLFLAEAFTRPRVMEHLAKIGFSQSYTYFAWRSSKWEIESYLGEPNTSEMADYFRPNLWPNTPDILTEELQNGGRAAYLSRFVLAATLSASYGIYGPTFELQESLPRSQGSEEYLHSEKYEVRHWNLKDPRSLSGFIAIVNQIRRDHPALQFNDTLTFHYVDNDQIIAYSKTRTNHDESDVVVVIVNLDHVYPQSGWVALDLTALGVDSNASYVMHDLLSDAHYVWNGSRNFVKLDPNGIPCHIFSLEQRVEPPRRNT